MFFINRWFSVASKKEILDGLKESKGDTINELADFLYRKEKLKRVYRIYDPRDLNVKKKTVLQKINTLWFFFIFWIIFAPIQYVKNGVHGFDQTKMSGKFVGKLIGRHYVRGKVSDYKSGWRNEIKRNQFISKMSNLGIKSKQDFISHYDSYYERNFMDDGFLIENVSKIYKDKRPAMKRFNELWLTPIMFLLLLFIGTYRWFKYDSFSFNEKGKIIKFFNEKTQE